MGNYLTIPDPTTPDPSGADIQNWITTDNTANSYQGSISTCLFLVDRSGSMYGHRFANVQQYIAGMTTYTTKHIYIFGDRFYGKVNSLANVSCDTGTDIPQSLSDMFAEMKTMKGNLRFVIATDAECSCSNYEKNKLLSEWQDVKDYYSNHGWRLSADVKLLHAGQMKDELQEILGVKVTVINDKNLQEALAKSIKIEKETQDLEREAHQVQNQIAAIKPKQENILSVVETIQTQVDGLKQKQQTLDDNIEDMKDQLREIKAELNTKSNKGQDVSNEQKRFTDAMKQIKPVIRKNSKILNQLINIESSINEKLKECDEQKDEAFKNRQIASANYEKVKEVGKDISKKHETVKLLNQKFANNEFETYESEEHLEKEVSQGLKGVLKLATDNRKASMKIVKSKEKLIQILDKNRLQKGDLSQEKQDCGQVLEEWQENLLKSSEI